MNITNEKVTDYLDGFYKIPNIQLKPWREESERKHIPIILKETERLLTCLLIMNQPTRILEIGTATGYSAVVMAKVLDKVEIVTMENNEERYLQALNNIKNMGLEDRITVKHGDAAEILKKLEKEGTELFDFVFIDAGKSHYKSFWDRAIKLTKEKSVIICDNVLMRATVVDKAYDPKGRHKTSIKKMQEFLEYITHIEGVETAVLASGDGISISCKK